MTGLLIFFSVVFVAVLMVPVVARITILTDDRSPTPVEAAEPCTKEALRLGYRRQADGRWTQEVGELELVLDGVEMEDELMYVHRLRVRGPWDGVEVRRRAAFAPEGGAFEAVYRVTGEAKYRIHEPVQHAFMVDHDVEWQLVRGMLVGVPGEAELASLHEGMLQLLVALDGAPGSDAELLRDVGQAGSVRAEALRRQRDPALAREVLHDLDPEVRLVAAQLIDDSELQEASLLALALDGSAPGAVRQRAVAGLSELTDELLASLVASDAPILWSIAAKAPQEPAERVALLRPLLRPGGLDPHSWPADHRAPHVGARLAMAIVEARPPDAEALLLQLLDMPEPRVKLQAVRGLGAVGTTQAVSALKALHSDPEPRVRVEVRKALQHLVGSARGGVSVAPVADGQGGLAVVDQVGGLSEPEEVDPDEPTEDVPDSGS